MEFLTDVYYPFTDTQYKHIVKTEKHCFLRYHQLFAFYYHEMEFNLLCFIQELWKEVNPNAAEWTEKFHKPSISAITGDLLYYIGECLYKIRNKDQNSPEVAEKKKERKRKI